MGIFRGDGGTGDSNTDATVTAVTEQATIATTKASEAADSATAAGTSATNAASSASASSVSSAASSTYAGEAASSATSAATSATASAASATAAATAETNAETAETNAETAETNAAASAATATTKAGEAATSATSASTSASTATTKASEASTSASNASTSETNAATSASTATTKASESSTSASNAATSATNAAASYDDFDDRYLGAKSSAPTTDNDGDALVTGALYFDTTTNNMKVWSGSAWLDAYASLSGALLANNNLSDLNNATTARTNLGLGTAATTASTDYATAAQGTKVDGIEAGADVTDTTNVVAALSAGTGISLSVGGVIANTSPDQAVALTGGTGISTSGTYPNFTITNDSPDQTVSLTGAGTTTVSGTYPNFTITGAGTTYTAGSGLSLTGTEFANTAPDQTVALTGAGATSISGTYPNFTITSTNTTYSVGDGGLTEINFTSADNTKLDGIEAGATADQTAAEILTAIKTVDGSGSGLDADLLQGSGLSATGDRFGVVPLVGADGVMEVGKYIDFHLTDGDTSDNSTRLTSVDSNTLNINSSKIWHAGNDGSGSGLDADTVDGVQATQLYRRTGASAATVGYGWVTVASNTSGRKHGEVIVSDSDSGDHSFIRIDWIRSYADSAFTVLNSGGHANRITAVRVLEETSDPTYGTKYLQVLVTTTSTYFVRINTVADVGGYSSHTAVTPVVQNTITGYSTDATTSVLDANTLASSQGILAGSGAFQGEQEDVELKYRYSGSSFSAVKASRMGVVTTAASGKIRFGSTTASFVQNGPGVSSNLTIGANGGSTFFYGSTNGATQHAVIASQSRFNCGYGSVQDAYMVRAWARYEMIGTHSFLDDEGFSSVTDIGTGRSRLNFTNTMPNTYYSVNVTTGSTSYTSAVCSASVYSLSTTLFYVSVEDLDGGFTDRDQMNVMVVR